MKIVFLWTDILIWLLTLSIFVFAIYSRNREHLKRPWKSILANKIALSSLFILLIYVMVALLDSIHFINSNNHVESYLDQLIKPLKTRQEKTYSAPFALHSLNKENFENSDGTITRINPKLKYSGAHLILKSDKGYDIKIKTTTAIISAILIWLFFLSIYIIIKAYKKSISIRQYITTSFKTVNAKHVLWFSMLMVLIVIVFMIYLSKYYHVFGTDKIGENVLYQAIKSIRTGLLIGTLTTLIMLPFAVALGLMSGYLQGWVDDIIQYTYTTINSIPGVLLIAASILTIQVLISNNPEYFSSAIEKSDLRMLSLCVILGITSWTGLCRILRSEVLKIREIEYVLAARTLGVSKFKIMLRHLLPNVTHIILISVVLDFSSLVLSEAVLSYIGIGVDPSTYSWGNMINSARSEMSRDPVIWWSLMASFSFMFVLVLAANLFADAVRSAFDPKIAK